MSYGLMLQSTSGLSDVYHIRTLKLVHRYDVYTYQGEYTPPENLGLLFPNTSVRFVLRNSSEQMPVIVGSTTAGFINDTSPFKIIWRASRPNQPQQPGYAPNGGTFYFSRVV
jgi:hypothetical protein